MGDVSQLPAAAQKAIVAQHNISTGKHFAEFLGSYIAFFVLLRFAYLLVHRYGKQFPTLATYLAFPTRVVRPFLLRKVPGFVSRGHALTVLVYILINIGIAFSYQPGLPFRSNRNWFPKRLGW